MKGTERALQAIQEFFTNTTRPIRETIKGLEEIKERVDEYLDSLEDDEED